MLTMRWESKLSYPLWTLIYTVTSWAGPVPAIAGIIPTVTLRSTLTLVSWLSVGKLTLRSGYSNKHTILQPGTKPTVTVLYQYPRATLRNTVQPTHISVWSVGTYLNISVTK